MKRLISFRMLKDVCIEKEAGFCEQIRWLPNYSVDGKDVKCTAENCQIWKKLPKKGGGMKKKLSVKERGRGWE